MTDKEKDLLEIESQLSFPDGENGIKMAKMMNETNITMTKAGIYGLGLSENDKVLEIGPGNGSHVSEIIKSGKNIIYSGLEISKTMINEAEKINHEGISSKTISFVYYDGLKIPFNNNSFHKIITVNTLYFWKEPQKFLHEIYRVLKPTGIFCLVFSKKEFLKELPFVQSKFKLYSNDDVLKLVENTAFEVVNIQNCTDQVKSKNGELVHRKFSVLSFTKK